MDFKLEINLDNSDFSFACEARIGDILDKVAKQINGGMVEAPIYDLNGNRVGKYEFTGF